MTSSCHELRRKSNSALIAWLETRPSYYTLFDNAEKRSLVVAAVCGGGVAGEACSLKVLSTAVSLQ